MSYLNLADYNDQLSNIASQFSAATEKDSLLNNIHDRANKAVELAGEAKAFVSAKPVGKYLAKKAGKALDDAVEKAGVKLNEFRQNFQASRQVASGVRNVVNTEGQAASRIVANPSVAGAEEDIVAGAGEKAVGENALVKPAIQSVGNMFKSNVGVESAETGERAELISERVGNLNARAGSLLDRLQSATGTSGGGAAQQPGILAPQANDSIEAGETQKANDQFNKTEAGEEEEEEGAGEEAEEGAGKGGKIVAEEEEDEEATESADAAVPEAAPITSIIGLIVGAGLAIKAAIDKPKQLAPVDKINASYQVGI